MATIKVNGTLNGLVHKGGNWFSAATLPDVCKTPTPGGPVPMPYPNISLSSSLSDGTTTVKVDGGNMAAIKGSKFASSSGDEPGSVGGIKSNTFKQASTWLLYSFDVKLDGANACRFSDKKFQNNENTVDAIGTSPIVVEVDLDKVKMECGELGQYKEQKKVSANDEFDRDHIPSKAALKEAAARRKGAELNPCEVRKVEGLALTIVTPKGAHETASRTNKSKNTPAQIQSDAGNLQQAANDDIKAMKTKKGGMKNEDKKCKAKYAESAKKIKDITNEDYDNWFDAIVADCAKRKRKRR